ncbi:hypothetical protein ACP70R_030613 [Stipagrostis hirtigluma subsp. patula]
MAMVQVGMGLGRAVLLVGVGLAAGPTMFNGKLSDILGSIQEALRETAAQGGDEAVKQVARLTMEVRELASHPVVTVLQVDAGKGASSALVAPAAAVGVVSYGYLRWKGISLSSLMYVTKRNMANAVASMTKHLEQVQSSLATAKKHLTQRIQHVDDKLDQQKQISGQIKDEVTGAKLKLKSIGSDMDKIRKLVTGLDEKMDSIEAKENFACAGVMYLCNRIEQSGVQLPERLESMQRNVRRLGINSNDFPGLGGLLPIEPADHGEGALQSTSLKSARLMLL